MLLSMQHTMLATRACQTMEQLLALLSLDALFMTHIKDVLVGFKGCV